VSASSGLAIALYICLYLSAGFALAVGGMKGRFQVYSGDDLEDTMTRGVAAFIIALLWPVLGVMITLGRLTK
jgi:Ca2+/H+ antiporter